MSWPFLSQKTGLFITNFKQFGSIFAGMGPKMCLEFWKSRILELLISIVWSMDKWILAKILSKFASDPGIIFKCGKTSNETIFITFSWFQNRVFITVFGPERRYNFLKLYKNSLKHVMIVFVAENWTLYH